MPIQASTPPTDDVEVLKGGNSNQVRREGKTILRETGAWSPFVHALLRYLEANGFTEAPVLIETDDQTERLSFLEGEVGNYPLKDYMRGESALIDAAKLLRRFHDLTAHFPMPEYAQFMLPVRGDHEVICHNDFAPYNCVFKEGRLVGVIDFDTASPGTRLWDMAYAVYRFAPLVTDDHCLNMGWEVVPDRAARLSLFCDAYGLEDRSALVETVIQRIELMVQFMRDNTFNVDHIPTYLNDLTYMRKHQHEWTTAIATPSGSRGVL